MAARNRCHERLFRIDRSRNRTWKGHARRRRGRWYFNASIEAPDVPAAVSVVDEGNALPLPFDRCVIFVCHVQFTQSGPGQIVRAEVQPRILGGALDLTVARTPESAVTYSYYDGLTSKMPFPLISGHTLKDKLSSDLAATEAEEGQRGIYMTT